MEKISQINNKIDPHNKASRIFLTWIYIQLMDTYLYVIDINKDFWEMRE